MSTSTPRYADHLPNLPWDYTWHITDEVEKIPRADGSVEEFPKVFVSVRFQDEPTKYYGRIDVKLYGRTPAVVELAHQIRSRVERDLPPPTPENLARWLSANRHSIASVEWGGQFIMAVKHAVDSIERAINRPRKPRELGPCPTIVAHHQKCATGLSAPRTATETTCPTCKTVHEVEYLVELLRHEIQYYPMSSVEILGSRTSDLPGALEYYNETLSRSTFHFWRKEKKLAVRGYRNKTTLAVMPERENDSDKPVFWLADVLDLMGSEWRKRQEMMDDGIAV